MCNLWKGLNYTMQWSRVDDIVARGDVYAVLVPASGGDLSACNNIDYYSPQIYGAKVGILWRCNGNIHGGNLECDNTDVLAPYTGGTIKGIGIEACSFFPTAYNPHPSIDAMYLGNTTIEATDLEGYTFLGASLPAVPSLVYRCGRHTTLDNIYQANGAM